MKNRNVTFSDIARYTNFSKTTISRYFNRPESLTPENQERIRQALVDLDYKENKVARILARGETEFVGILLPNLYMHYFAELLNQILQTYETFGYKFLVFVGNQREDAERQYLEELMAYKIEGLIVMSYTLPSEELAAFPVPVVSIEREDRFISSVNCDNYMGAVQATSLLAKCGCEILIHINQPTPENVPAWQRIKGFQDFCADHHLNSEVIIRDMGNAHSSVERVLTEIMAEIEQKYPGKKKGIFFSDDTRANVFLNLVVRKYGTFPEDYRLIGFDNSPVAESAVYPISTVGQQIGVIAKEAVSLLVRQIEQRKAGEEPALEHKVITPVLIRRATTEGAADC